MNDRVFMVVMMLGAILSLIEAADAQTGAEPVALSIRLRAPDGSPLAGEPVALQRLPDEEAVLPACTTDAQGMCTWYVGRALYQVLFDQPLDEVSALALAEGGLRGFGLTVGAIPVTYHFTLHSDDHVYFDASPEAARPAPIIPTLDLLHGGIKPTPSPEKTVEPEPTNAPLAEHSSAGGDGVGEGDVESTPDGTERPDAGWRWRLVLLVGLGVAMGGGLHLLRLHSGQARGRRRKSQAARRADKTEDSRA